MDGMALRVPVSNGSIIDVGPTLKGEVTKDEVNKIRRDESEMNLKGILAYTEEPIVSSDIIGESHSSNGNMDCLRWFWVERVAS